MAKIPRRKCLSCGKPFVSKQQMRMICTRKSCETAEKEYLRFQAYDINGALIEENLKWGGIPKFFDDK